jgi:integrase
MAKQAKSTGPKRSGASSGAQRRPRHGGGLYEKTRTRVDPTSGRTITVVYWEASWDVPTDRLQPGTGRKRITGSGATPSIALRNLERNKEAYLSGKSHGRETLKGIPKGSVPSVRQLYEVWIAEIRTGAVSDIVASKYAGFFTNHVLPHIGDRPINRLDKRTLSLLFADTLPKKRKVRNGTVVGPLLSTSSQLNIYRSLSKFLTYAEVHGYIEYNPLRAVPAPKVSVPKIDVDRYSLLADQLLDKLAADDDPDHCRWLMQFLGLRRAERLGLRWSDITDLASNNPTMIVRRQLARYADGGWYLKGTKTGRERTISIPEPWLSALRAHKLRQDELRQQPAWKPRKGFDDLVFLRADGSHYTLNADNLDWHAVLDRHGLPYWRGHINRHITASRLAATDPPTPLNVVFSILGHDSDAIGHYYSKVMKQQQVPAMTTYGETFMQRRKR